MYLTVKSIIFVICIKYLVAADADTLTLTESVISFISADENNDTLTGILKIQ